VFTFVPPNNTEPLSNTGDARVRSGDVAPALAWNAGFRSWQLEERGAPLAELDEAVAARFKSLQLVVTHGAGELDPVTAARRVVALQALSDGRISLRVPARGFADTEWQPSHIAFWRRTDEYLMLLKRLWANERPIDHEGPFYSVAGGFVPRKQPPSVHVPIRMSGLSGTALNVAGKHADVFELTAGSPDEARLLAGRVRAAAARHGRQGKVRFALPVHWVADDAHANAGFADLPRLPAQAALSLLGFIDAGVSEFMVAGIETTADLDAFGHVASFVRNSLARRDAAWAASSAVAAGRFDLVQRYGF
jgi:alkanesulfonate monooxygenase